MASDPAETVLREAGRAAEDAIDLAATALAFALYDRPDLDLTPYRAHLSALAQDLAEESRGAGGDARARAAALAATLAGKHGYLGDAQTYDDLANADLARVVDRRRGLPVALGILWMHAARAQRWAIAGLDVPGHFLLRLDGSGDSAVIDAYHGGKVLTDAEIEAYRRAAGDSSSGPPGTVSDRAVLLRLRNNTKLRLVRSGEVAAALRVVQSAILIAPRTAGLWRDAAMLNAQLGNLGEAQANLRQAIALAPPDQRPDMQGELEALRRRLN